MKRRVLSALLALCVAMTMTPTALAAEGKPYISVYTAEEIQQLLDGTETPEGMEQGMFSFPAAAYAVRRTETGLEIPLLRFGSCESEAQVILAASDISATYGTDYILEINGEALSAETDAMQLVATEDKSGSADVLLTEENLEAMETLDEPEEPAELDESAESAESLWAEEASDPMENLDPEEAAESEAETADPLTFDTAHEEAPPSDSLAAIKEAWFGRVLTQTDRFYGDSNEAGAAGAAPLELPALQSVRTTLRFEAGERYKTLCIKLLPQGTSAGDESFHLALTALTEGTGLGEYPSAAVALKHEGKLEQSIVGFADTEISAGGGAAEVKVVREKGEYNAAAVSFTTSAGTLEPGIGYSPTSETLLFLPGETEKTVRIPVMDATEGGTFSCLLSDPKGAALSGEEALVTVPKRAQRAAASSADSLKETWDFKMLQNYISSGGSQFLRGDNKAYIMENWLASKSSPNLVYNIATTKRPVSGVAYKKVTVHYDSFGEYAGGSWKYNWNDRRANTLTTCLWKDGVTPYYVGVPWRPNYVINSVPTSFGLYSQWFHPGIGSENVLYGQSDSITIPNSGCNDTYTLSFQQRHFHPWLSGGAIHVTSIDLERRYLRFEYLHHDPFPRRLGSLTDIQPVNNIFQLTATAGRGENSTYVIGDTVGYQVQGAAQDPLYDYMASLGRSGVRDGISANATGASPLTLEGNSGFALDDTFFKKYSGAFVQDGYGSSNKVAYIKPAYNREKWRANLTLEQSADGSTQLGFLNSSNVIVPLSQYPAYLSEEVTLRAAPKPGLYFKGYRMEYKDYDNVTRYSTVELGEGELSGWQGKARDIRIPVRYSAMKITPIYTSLPSRKITVTVDAATKPYGVSFPEGVQEALLDAQGNRIGEIEMGSQITEFATAKSGYVPVWTRNGVRYSGESYDFEIGAEDVDIRIGLSFEKQGVISHGISGTIREPKVTINTLLATDFGVDAPKMPLAGVTIATGKITAESGEDGAFTLPASQNGNQLASIAGTRRTIRIIRGGESFIREAAVPAAGSVSLGVIDLPLAANLPCKINGVIIYTKTDSQGNLNTYESNFGGIGQDNSNLFRYDAATDQVTGSIRWIGAMNTTYNACELIFTNKQGVEVSRIKTEKDPSGNFTFHFNPVQDTRAGGGVYLSLTDRKGDIHGPYDTGIQVSDPPAGDIELMEGPSVEIPIKDISLPIVKMTKPNFSSGLFQGNFDKTGMRITVGFDVKKLYDAAKKNTKKDNKSAADAVSAEAKKQDAASDKPKAQGATGKVTANVKDISFACTLSFAYFDSSGKVLAHQEPGAVLAIYNAIFYLGASGGASAEVSASIYGVPVYLEISGTASVAIIVSLSAEDGNGKKSHFPLKTFNESPTTLKAEGLVPVSLGLGLEAGVGKKKVFALYLGGNMDFDFKWFPWKTGTGTVTFAAGGGLYVFGQKLGVNYKFDPILMFDTTKSGFSSDYSEETPSREAVESVQTPNFDFDFSETDTGGLQAAGVTLLEGVLHDTHPRIADIGDGKTMLVFLANAPNEDGVNRTALHYSIFDGKSATEPVLIDGDGTLDASPDVMDLGDKVLIVWSDSRRDDFGETAEVRDIMASMDIRGVFYDKASETLGREFSITSDSQEDDDAFYLPADCQPAIYYDESTGSVAVYFIKEDFGLLDTGGDETVQDFMNGRTTAAYCPIDVETERVSLSYLPEEQVPERFQSSLNGQRLLDVGLDLLDSGLSDPKIESFAVGTAGGYTVFAYPVDLDQSAETMDDQMLFAVLIDQSTGKRYAPICLTDEPAALGAPRFVRNEAEVEGQPYRTNDLIWQSNGKLLCCDMETLLEHVSFDGDACTLSEQFAPAEYVPQPTETFTIGNDSLVAAANGGVYTVTTRQDGVNSEVFVQYYTGQYTRSTSEGEGGDTSYVVGNGRWSEPVQVTKAAREDSRQHILLKDAAAGQDGSLLLLCDRFDGAADTGDLCLFQITPSPALASDMEVFMDQDYPRAGDTVRLFAEPRSTGLLDSVDVDVEFAWEDGNGTKTPIGSWTGTVPAGGQAQASTEWTVPDGLTKDCKIVASAPMAEGVLDFPLGEVVTLDDISYRYLDHGEAQSQLAVSATLQNRGNISPNDLTLQICSVDKDEFTQGISDENADPESAYTELARIHIPSPFTDGDFSPRECQVTLPNSGDQQPKELLVRAIRENGEPFDTATEFVAIMPPAENAPLVERTSSSSGSSSVSNYSLTATAGEGGTIDPSGKVSVSRNSDKTFTIMPEDGYEIADVLVDCKSVGAVSSYTFEKVTGNHTIAAAFQPRDERPGPAWNPFADVKEADWFHDSVKYVYQRSLMSGTSDRLFSPGLPTTRGMIVTILHRLEGEPESGSDMAFTDVKEGAYYYDAIRWAAEQQIVKGYDAVTFGPDNTVTRQELAAILYRYSRYKGYDVTANSDLKAFADRPDPWAEESVRWAVGAGILTGKGGGRLDPSGRATRAETAAMLTRFLQTRS